MPTFLDRRDPDGALALRASGLGIFVGGVTAAVLALRVGAHWWELPVGLAAGCLGGGGGLLFARGIGGVWQEVAMSGGSAPYEEQHSRQDALVMQGKVDEALALFEALIASQPEAVAPRVKAAELYVRECRNFERAADLFRSALQSHSISVGEHVYVTNRLVDLLIGPLAQPGRALVELRRLIDRYPISPAAAQARQALATLKDRQQERFAPRPPFNKPSSPP
jgi:hypothetical protein